VGGGLIPLLSLGIPGTPAIAVISGALMMQGITPGPNLMNSNPNLIYTSYWGILLAVIAMFIFGRYATSLFARILLCPNYVLIAVISVLLLIGAHVGRYFSMDIWVCMAAGVLGFFMSRLKFSLTAFTIAFVLADLIEIRFRRGLMLGNNSLTVFFTRPFCIMLWILLIWMVVTAIRSSRQNKTKGFTEDDLKKVQ
jgi:putative tricarboxylic transport membrane protein